MTAHLLQLVVHHINFVNFESKSLLKNDEMAEREW